MVNISAVSCINETEIDRPVGEMNNTGDTKQLLRRGVAGGGTSEGKPLCRQLITALTPRGQTRSPGECFEMVEKETGETHSRRTQTCGCGGDGFTHHYWVGLLCRYNSHAVICCSPSQP